MDADGVTRLRGVIGRMARQLNASSTGEGLTPSQASVLALVTFRGPLSLAELADLEGLNPTMLSRVVGRLLELELIRRIPDPTDLRSASVISTPAGQEVDQRVKTQRAAVMTECVDQLSADQEQALNAALPALEALTEALKKVDSPVTGTARIDGRPVLLGADDFTVRGGSGDAAIHAKQVFAEQYAGELRLPVVRLLDGASGGGSVKMTLAAGSAYVPVNPAWDAVVDNLSVVPVVAACLGPVVGLGAARLVMSHLAVMVPQAELIVRRVYGVGGAAIVSRHRAGRSWAWPSGDWGSLPARGGVEAAFRAELERADDPAAEAERIRQRLAQVGSPFRTAERFGVQDLIDPRDSRPLLCAWVRDAYRTLPQLTGRPVFGTRP